MEGIIPRTISLSKIYPNPFNSSVAIEVENESGQGVEIDVYDITGRWVDTIYSGWLNPGFHRFLWRATDESDHASSSGVYLVNLRGERNIISKTVVLLR
ncbi:MAG: T9SS type A sorting domain-containing protein [Candidatus Neomarinimicrobiota bacterium]